MSELVTEPGVAEVTAWVRCLAQVDAAALPGGGSATVVLSDAERIDLLAALEGLKAAAAAAQARVTAAFAASQRDALTAVGVPTGQQARSIGAQVALARRVSPRQGSRHVGLAQALVSELPATLAALAAGETSEWRATLVARETACLSREDRAVVDAELAARPGGIGGMGDGQIARESRRVAYRLDPGAVVRRAERAVGQRCVTLRPAPDAMTYLTALLPLTAAVAAHAALTRVADTARAHGDPRSRGQLMADTLTARLTRQETGGSGSAAAHDPTRWDSAPPAAVPEQGGKSGHGAPSGARVEVQLVMTDAALLGSDDTPAEVVGYGPVPAFLARRLLRDTGSDGSTESAALREQAAVWVRRLYTAPDTGRLVAMDSRAREFPRLLRQFLIARDEVCRTPWCDAPVRHADHVTPSADGGPTRRDNGQGLCQGCNQVKATPGWTARPGADGTVMTTTPTGHTWTSHEPDRWMAPPDRPSPPVQEPLQELLASAGEARLRRLVTSVA